MTLSQPMKELAYFPCYILGTTDDSYNIIYFMWFIIRFLNMKDKLNPCMKHIQVHKKYL